MKVPLSHSKHYTEHLQIKQNCKTSKSLVTCWYKDMTKSKITIILTTMRRIQCRQQTNYEQNQEELKRCKRELKLKMSILQFKVFAICDMYMYICMCLSNKKKLNFFI